MGWKRVESGKRGFLEGRLMKTSEWIEGEIERGVNWSEGTTGLGRFLLGWGVHLVEFDKI